MKLFQEIKKKFLPSLNGLKVGMKHRSIVIQSILALLAMIVSWVMKFTTFEWVYVIVAIGLVISVEYLNTAIEEIVNRVSPEKSEFAMKTKDLAAAAVLLISIAVLIGYVLIIIRK